MDADDTVLVVDDESSNRNAVIIIVIIIVFIIVIFVILFFLWWLLRRRGTPCTSNSQCGDGMMCVGGECVSSACNGNRDCPTGMRCNGGQCVTPQCSSTNPCGDGYSCVNGICVANIPPEEPDAPPPPPPPLPNAMRTTVIGGTVTTASITTDSARRQLPYNPPIDRGDPLYSRQVDPLYSRQVDPLYSRQVDPIDRTCIRNEDLGDPLYSRQVDPLYSRQVDPIDPADLTYAREVGSSRRQARSRRSNRIVSNRGYDSDNSILRDRASQYPDREYTYDNSDGSYESQSYDNFVSNPNYRSDESATIYESCSDGYISDCDIDSQTSHDENVHISVISDEDEEPTRYDCGDSAADISSDSESDCDDKCDDKCEKNGCDEDEEPTRYDCGDSAADISSDSESDCDNKCDDKCEKNGCDNSDNESTESGHSKCNKRCESSESEEDSTSEVGEFPRSRVTWDPFVDCEGEAIPLRSDASVIVSGSIDTPNLIIQSDPVDSFFINSKLVYVLDNGDVINASTGLRLSTLRRMPNSIYGYNNLAVGVSDGQLMAAIYNNDSDFYNYLNITDIYHISTTHNGKFLWIQLTSGNSYLYNSQREVVGQSIFSPKTIAKYGVNNTVYGVLDKITHVLTVTPGGAIHRQVKDFVIGLDGTVHTLPVSSNANRIILTLTGSAEVMN